MLLDDIAPVWAYLALGGLVGVESVGVPVPGETALIAAGILSRHQLNIEAVIVIATCAAIIGDNIGYLIGRKFGRPLLEKPGPFHHHRHEMLARGGPFFERHGPKAVFFGRWFAGLRVAAALLSGINHMQWRKFLFWNALGGVCWATSIGLLAYYLGPTAEKIVKDIGLGGLIAIAVLIVGFFFWRYLRRRRATRI